MNTPNEQAWLKQMATRPDETPSRETALRMEERLLQRVRRYRKFRTFVRFNIVGGTVLAAILLAVGLMSSSGQELLRSAFPSNTPPASPVEETRSRLEAFYATLAGDERLFYHDGRDTFIIMKNDERIIVVTPGNRHTAFQAPDGMKLQISTGHDMRWAVRAHAKGQPDRLFLYNVTDDFVREVPLTGGEKIHQAAGLPNSDTLMIQFDAADGSKQTFESIRWDTGERSVLMTKEGIRFNHLSNDGIDTYFLGSPYELIVMHEGQLHTVATTEGPELSFVTGEPGRAIYQAGALPYKSYVDSIQLLAYDYATRTSKALLPNVPGEQQLVWSSAADEQYLVGAFLPTSNTRPTEEEAAFREPGTLELWLITKGRAERIYTMATTYDNHSLHPLTIDGEMTLTGSSFPVKPIFRFDPVHKIVEPIPPENE